MKQILVFVILLLDDFIVGFFGHQGVDKLELALVHRILNGFHQIITMVEHQVSDTELATLDGDAEHRDRFFELGFFFLLGLRRLIELIAKLETSNTEAARSGRCLHSFLRSKLLSVGILSVECIGSITILVFRVGFGLVLAIIVIFVVVVISERIVVLRLIENLPVLGFLLFGLLLDDLACCDELLTNLLGVDRVDGSPHVGILLDHNDTEVKVIIIDSNTERCVAIDVDRLQFATSLKQVKAANACATLRRVVQRCLAPVISNVGLEASDAAKAADSLDRIDGCFVLPVTDLDERIVQRRPVQLVSCIDLDA